MAKGKSSGKQVDTTPASEAVDTPKVNAIEEAVAEAIGQPEYAPRDVAPPRFPFFAKKSASWGHIRGTLIYTVLATDPSGLAICYSEGTGIKSIPFNELERIGD